MSKFRALGPYSRHEFTIGTTRTGSYVPPPQGAVLSFNQQMLPFGVLLTEKCPRSGAFLLVPCLLIIGVDPGSLVEIVSYGRLRPCGKRLHAHGDAKRKTLLMGSQWGFCFSLFFNIYFYLAFYRGSVGIITVESPLFFQSVGSSGWVVVMVGW